MAMTRLLAATADWPLNVGLQACARAEDDGSLEALLDAGACGFKIHEDYGADPALIDHTAALRRDPRRRGRAAHRRPARERRAGGHGRGHRRPDRPRLPRRGQRRRPRARRHRARPRAEHHLLVDDADRALGRQRGRRAGADDRPQPRRVVRRWPTDVALVRERVHEATMAAEGPLHELGAIAIVNSDSQGMGRMLRDRPADVPAGARHARLGRATTLGPDGHDDTARVLRYLAKVTIEPAITHGLAEHVGSLQPGRLADIVLWEPAYFGVKPALVLKGGLAGLGAARRGQRHGRGRRADPLPTRLGRAGPVGRGRLGHVRVGRGRRPRRRRPCAATAGRSIAVARHARPDPRRRWSTTGRPPPSTSTCATAGSRLDGRAAGGRAGPRGPAEPALPAALTAALAAWPGVSGSSRSGRG